MELGKAVNQIFVIITNLILIANFINFSLITIKITYCAFLLLWPKNRNSVSADCPLQIFANSRCPLATSTLPRNLAWQLAQIFNQLLFPIPVSNLGDFKMGVGSKYLYIMYYLWSGVRPQSTYFYIGTHTWYGYDYDGRPTRRRGAEVKKLKIVRKNEV